MEEGKPFEISKHQVMEACRRVKANHGAGGTDGVDFTEFEKGSMEAWGRFSCFLNNVSKTASHIHIMQSIKVRNRQLSKPIVRLNDMEIIIDLDEIIKGMESQSAEMRSFLNLKTGEVVLITDEEFQAAEEDEPLEKFPEWQRESIVIAGEILEEDFYVPLPSQYDIHEYSIMERFCLSIDDDNLQNIMYNSIKGSGVFRRFKDNIHRYHIAEDWYEYRDEAIKQIAIEWCEDNGIRYK